MWSTEIKQEKLNHLYENKNGKCYNLLKEALKPLNTGT